MIKTPLFNLHKKMNAKMIDFHGCKMPLNYSGIIKEHKTVRNKAGIFDISHMGEIIIKGREASPAVQKIITNDINKLKQGTVLYTTICSYTGGILDDLLVYKIENDKYMLVVNAANTKKDFNWILKNTETYNCKVKDRSETFSLVAVQGPQSLNILKNLVNFDLENLNNFNFRTCELNKMNILISRTGYTGERGYELYIKPEDAEKIWNTIYKKGENFGLKPVGLGARNTLRLEKGLCLYGNDITEDNHPLEAGLGKTVKFNKKDFIGKKALLKIKQEGFPRVLSGFIMENRRIPRKNYNILSLNEEKIVGKVTSGSYSPTLDKNIGLGYIEKELAVPGNLVLIEIREEKYKAKIVKLPFL